MGSVRKAREIDAALRKKGFRRETDGKHIHYFFRDSEGGKSGIFTLMSHGMAGSSLSANLLSQMARQLRLSKPRFLDLIDCSLDENGYRDMFREQNEAD